MFNVIFRTFVGDRVAPLQRCNWCILQPLQTELYRQRETRLGHLHSYCTRDDYFLEKKLTSIFTYIWYQSNNTSVVKGDPKVLFSIAITLRCGEGTTPFPGLLHFTLDPYLIMLSVKQSSMKYHFLSLWYDSTGDWTSISRTIGKHFTH